MIVRQVFHPERRFDSISCRIARRQVLIHCLNSIFNLLNTIRRSKLSDYIKVLPVFECCERNATGCYSTKDELWVKNLHMR